MQQALADTWGAMHRQHQRPRWPVGAHVVAYGVAELAHCQVLADQVVQQVRLNSLAHSWCKVLRTCWTNPLSVNRTQASGKVSVQRLPVRRTATMVASAAAAPQPKTAGSGIQWARLQGCRLLGAHVVVRHIWGIHSIFLLIPRQGSVLIPNNVSVPIAFLNLKLFNGIQCTPTDCTVHT